MLKAFKQAKSERGVIPGNHDSPDRREAEHARSLLDRNAVEMLAKSIEIDGSIAVLGLIRFRNHDQMSAYDAAAARRAMTAFVTRLYGAASDARPIAQVERDTFAIWFLGCASAEAAISELQAISYVMGQEIADGDLVVTPDIHLGIAVFPTDTTDAASLIGRAMVSLAPLRRGSMVRLAAARGPSPREMHRKFALEQALRQAVRASQLSLHYQPFVNIAEGRVSGAEALLRWTHPTFGPVSPTEFVPILEETGLVHEIGLWTVNTACRDLRSWRDGGFSNFRLALNLSAVQLQDPQLKDLILRTVTLHDLAPTDIELELTETAAMEDQARTAALFTQLRTLGFGIAIDDFGSGYSSLGYLKNLPFTKLKIDREFVSGLDSDKGGRAICKALIELGEGLGISVLAEGVERVEEVNELQALGCSTFQGFYFSRPLAAPAFAEKLRDPEWTALIASAFHRGSKDAEGRSVL